MRGVVVIAIVVAASACRHVVTGPTLDVAVYAGDVPAPGTTIVSYRPDGSEIDLQSTDTDGRVALVIENDAMIGIGFAGGNVAQYATLPVPSNVPRLDIYGPPPYVVPSIAGVLTVAPLQTITADTYTIELGCTIRQVTALPAMIEVPSPCTGTDTNLAVVIVAYSAGQIVGFGAQSPIEFDSGTAMFAPATWQPPPQPTIGDDPGAMLDWSVIVDGLPYSAPAGADWGLQTNGEQLVATLGSGDTIQATTYGTASSTLIVQATDFLAPIAPSLVLDDRATMKLHGGTCDPNTAAATNVRVTWNDNGAAVWDVVMPPGPIAVAFPPAFAAPPAGAQVTTIERCIVGDQLFFSGLIGVGIHLEDAVGLSTITRPWPGELKSTQTSDSF